MKNKSKAGCYAPQLVVLYLVVGQVQGAPILNDEVPPLTDSSFVIGFETVDIPKQHILLVRTKNELCALQLTDFSRPVIDRKVMESAGYRVYRVRPEQIGDGRLEAGRFLLKGYFGLGHWQREVGNTMWKCGGHRLGWLYPNRILFARNPGLAVAPTAWTRFSDVRFQDPRLTWWEEDSTTERKPQTFPIRALPGAELTQ